MIAVSGYGDGFFLFDFSLLHIIRLNIKLLDIEIIRTMSEKLFMQNAKLIGCIDDVVICIEVTEDTTRKHFNMGLLQSN